ncbi:NitT/TauT family transport system permease protein [Methylobacterium sp. BE186]|uniref:ABC transporter permease n=1 Tax=Methylobacterium sp. BE186 TaxID=2817715 RepID=UPI002864E9DE|nr:ABC transporter permease [Methylobacterium sp. BE186]MDR7038950.1 NitT/TauT family transport system permease protein [Methylobacterium sp. BE186]
MSGSAVEAALAVERDVAPGRGLVPVLSRLAPLAGLAGLLALWYAAGLVLESVPAYAAFAGFAPGPALAAFRDLIATGEAWRAAGPSLARVGEGLAFAFLLGAPVGLLVGSSPLLERVLQPPFQLLRMISPLAWMPVAVLAFPSWNGAIVFLIAAAAIWPILFATAAGVKRVDPVWLTLARNLGAGRLGALRAIVVPAVTQDILTGLRLALGVAWIVLVPAEYLGVTSGLGYAINDARDTLSYDRLAALVLLIGLIGYALDAALGRLAARARWIPAT